jgi:hypothetical protein
MVVIASTQIKECGMFDLILKGRHQSSLTVATT